MENFNDLGSGEQVKQGRYANALILFLMSALVAVASYFAYVAAQNKSSYESMKADFLKSEAERMQREDKIRDSYQAKLDDREKYHEGRYNLLQNKIDSIRDNMISEMKMGRVKSEALATQSTKIVKSVQGEVKKTVEATKEFDSATKSLSQ